MWMRARRAVSTITVIAAGAVLIGATVPGLIGTTEAATTPPWAKMGYKDGPVPIPITMGQIAVMSLPAGKYVVSAKAVVDATDTYVDCRLRLSNSWDDGYFGEGFGTLALNVATTLSTTRNVTLSCAKRASQGSAQATWIKITATRVGTLNIVQLP